jgi:hypothetical protein
MDKQLLQELKKSIGSESNSEISSCSKSNPPSPENFVFDKTDAMVMPFSPLDLKSTISKNNYTNLSTNINVSDKKNYTSIFKKNVGNVMKIRKATSGLSIDTNSVNSKIASNSKITSNAKISDQEVNEMFFGIEKSCDNIINVNECVIDQELCKSNSSLDLSLHNIIIS